MIIIIHYYYHFRSRKDYASPDTQGFFENHIWPQYCDTERTAFSLTSGNIRDYNYYL